MAETRVEAIDERLRELGYPEAALALYHEDLFCFARNFAWEADRQQVEVERLQAIVDNQPQTEDGVPIMDGTVTYCGERTPFPHKWNIRTRGGKTPAEHGERQYSTREAAEAANKEN